MPLELMPRVLVIDDDPDIRAAIEELLLLEGFEVATACDGREGLDKATTEDHFAAIVLDLMMPRMNGWQFRSAQKCDPHLAQVPVIAVTASSSDGIDADRVLSKPFAAAELVEAVRAAAAQRAA